MQGRKGLHSISQSRCEADRNVVIFLPPFRLLLAGSLFCASCFARSSRPTNSCAPTANATPRLMGCGASKDGASGNAGDRPNKQGDPMVSTFVQSEASVAGPVRQVALRLTQAGGRPQTEVDLALRGPCRARPDGPEAEPLPLAHSGGQSGQPEERPTPD